MEVSAQGFMAMAAALLCTLTISCEKAPPREYAVLNAPAPERPDDDSLSATLIFEVIEVNDGLFEGWIAQNALVSNAATPLRKAAQSWIHEGGASLSETLTLSVKNGGSSQIQSEQLVLSPEGEPAFLAHKPGISLEASVSINPDSRECEVRLHPTVLSSDGSIENSKTGNRSHWSKAELTATISLPELAYGFLGSCAVGPPESTPQISDKKTSLFFLRADTNLRPQSAPKPTSQL